MKELVLFPVSGSSFCDARLRVSGPAIKFEQPILLKFFCLLLVTLGVAIFFGSLWVLFFGSNVVSNVFPYTLIGLALCVTTLVLSIRQTDVFFDLDREIGIQRKKFNSKSIKFDVGEITQLYIVSKRVSRTRQGIRRFKCYELNLELNSGRRINLLNHANKKHLVNDADELSSILGVSLTNYRSELL